MLPFGLGTTEFLIVLILVAGNGVWLYTLVNAILAADGSYRAGTKLLWVLVIVFAGWFGSLAYLLVGRPRSL